MTKQIGRVPTCTRCNRTAGASMASWRSTWPAPGPSRRAAIGSGHVGHLVQVPSGEAREAAGDATRVLDGLQRRQGGRGRRGERRRGRRPAPARAAARARGHVLSADTREGSWRSGSSRSPTASTRLEGATFRRRDDVPGAAVRPRDPSGSADTEPRHAGAGRGQSYAAPAAATSRSTRPVTTSVAVLAELAERWRHPGRARPRAHRLHAAARRDGTRRAAGRALPHRGRRTSTRAGRTATAAASTSTRCSRRTR